MISGFLGEITEFFSDLIQIKKIPFSGGRPAEWSFSFETPRFKIFLLVGSSNL